MKKLSIVAIGVLMPALGACTEEMDSAGVVMPSGDTRLQAQACIMRMSAELGLPAGEVTDTSGRVDGDGSTTITLQSDRGDNATCLVDADNTVVALNLL